MKIAISKEAVDKFKDLYKQKYDEVLPHNSALFALGFDLDEDIVSKVVTYRVQAKPSCVTTGTIYEGRLRKATECVLNDKILLSKKPHPLGGLYSQFEVVSGDIIPEDLTNILDIGNVTY